MTAIEEYKIGSTKIKIYDDFCKDKKQPDINKSLSRIADIARMAKRG